jgi:hypothetical protein
MSFESASNPNDPRWDADNHSGNSVSNGDEASLTGLFQHAFGAVATSSSATVPDEDFPFDAFEANVMTACMLSAADTVQLPVDFEEQVMARIQQEAAPQQAAATPRSFRSPLLRHTSRELYMRYRKVVQVVFPLAAAASIVLAIYVNDSKDDVNRGTFGPESIQNIIGSETTAVKPDVRMNVPPASEKAIQKDEQQKDKAVKSKKKVKPKGPAIITGE